MISGMTACPSCGLGPARKCGRDRRGRQIVQCQRRRRRFTALTDTPFSGHRFPPEVIGLAVRWYLRFRLTLADVAELLAERGIHVDPSTVHAWVGKFAPRYAAAAPAFRLPIGRRWHVDETYVAIAGRWCDAYRAVDEHGQVVDVSVSERRAATDAAAFFRRAIEETGVAPTRVTTDRAATYPPALAEVLPGADHETGKLVQQRIERDHGHLKGRLRPTRGFKTVSGARTLCAGHGFMRNLAGGFSRLGCIAGDASLPRAPLPARAWDELTAELLASYHAGDGQPSASADAHVLATVVTAQVKSTSLLDASDLDRHEVADHHAIADMTGVLMHGHALRKYPPRQPVAK